jgi:hypothetical protein
MKEPVAIQIGQQWFNTSFIKDVTNELQQKSGMVRAGLDSFTKSETLAYLVIKGSASYLDVDE